MLTFQFNFQIRLPDMDEVIDAFNLLALELPDPEQELSPQNLRPKLETFTCFPELPFELRSKIWRFTFPGRRIIDLTLATQHIVRFRTRGRPADPKLPVALHVNQESRSIALKAYYIIFQQQPRWVNKKQPTGMRPICFDPKVDSVFVDLNDILIRINPHKMFGKDLECLNMIKTLEIRNFRWLSEVDYFDKSTSYALHHSKGGVLKYLRGLEDVHLVSRPDGDIFDELVDDSDKCFVELVLCFSEHARFDPGRKPFPQIWLHDYRRRKTRSDQEQLLAEMFVWPWLCEEWDDERASSDSD
jgi:2EXR family